MKRKLKSEGSELHENIVQLKMKAQDGKMRETDTLDTKGIFRLIESVPSSKAEPFKVWLAYEKETKKSAISKSNSLNYKYIEEQKQIEEKKGK